MIKRIQFVGSSAEASGTAAPQWRERLAAAVDAPPEARPTRVAVCTAVPDEHGEHGDEPPRHPAVGLTWFLDVAHLERFQNWSASEAGDDSSTAAGLADASGRDLVVVADEHVMRGADWLGTRWKEGGVSFKHMALARRAVGLTPAEFAERWSTGAGRVTRPDRSESVVIPDDVRGCAYVQNRPRPRAAEWPYDAVNEVWFDDLAGLRRRVDWFRDHVGAGDERDLISENWFLVVREDVLLPARPAS